MSRTVDTDRISGECWDRALFAYGTAQLFLKRSLRYRAYLRFLAFIGIAGPVVIGVVVIHHIVSPKHLDLFVWVVSVIAVIEALVSLWSLAANWPDNLSYAQRSTAENLALSSAFRELGQQADSPPVDLRIQFTELRSRDESRRATDAEQGVTEKEKRYAHHAGLLQFKRQCEGCKQVPTSMDPSDCGMCGRYALFNFSFGRKSK
jgi:mobilome CxxCx(11)CxxC protein